MRLCHGIDRLRPIMLVNAKGVPGTLAALARGRDGRPVLLTGWHVLFGAGANAGDPVWRVDEQRVGALLSTFQALLPVTDFDVQELASANQEQQLATLAEDIQARVQQLRAAVQQCIATINDKLAAHDAQAAAEGRIRLLTEAARAAFGDDFVLVPSFTMAERQASEWNNAYAGREALLHYQKNVLHNDFPVDNWLYGTARVREKMHHLENLTFLAEAYGSTAPDLRPVQFPRQVDAPWMALEFPPEKKATLERDLLLYTALYPEAFDASQPQCGLLLDEWTEVIPLETETTGVAFHFDRANSEPPQAMLLVTPPQFTGSWRWEDLVDALHETLERARTRAVEPQQLDQTELSVFLPATVLATTWQPITVAADLARVNKFTDHIVTSPS